MPLEFSYELKLSWKWKLIFYKINVESDFIISGLLEASMF